MVPNRTCADGRRLLDSAEMPTSHPGLISARAWARLVLLVGVVFGVIAMHGLAGHGGGSGSKSMAHAAYSTMTDASGMAQPMSPTTTTRSSVPSMTDGLAGLCVAVIGTALGLVLLQIGRPRRSRPAFSTSRGASVAASLGRDRDPPCLVRLSIQRC
jgi:hypothetical protein